MAFVIPALAAVFGSTSVAAGALALGSAAAGMYMQRKQAKAMERAMRDSVKPPEKPPQPSKGPDRTAITAANAAAAGAGGAMAGNRSTFLTGPGGVDSGSLNLGKNSLLGQ